MLAKIAWDDDLKALCYVNSDHVVRVFEENDSAYLELSNGGLFKSMLCLEKTIKELTK